METTHGIPKRRLHTSEDGFGTDPRRTAAECINCVSEQQLKGHLRRFVNSVVVLVITVMKMAWKTVLNKLCSCL
jgi:hypothetical protein